MPESTTQDQKLATIGRRSVVQGAAWATPVIAVSVTAPAFAASACPNPVLVPVAAPAPGSPTAGTTTWTVPQGVTSLTFTVLGGAGGATPAANYGGAGSMVTGTLSVAAGDILTLIVGQGGAGQLTGTAPAPGQGFGNGGAGGTPRPASATYTGASGGGGSAILVNGAPAVVAGGGGGGGSSIHGPGAPAPSSITNQVSAQSLGGAGDTSAPTAEQRWNVEGRRQSPRSGLAGTGGVGGAGGPLSADATPVATVTSTAGTAGSNFAAAGGNGGAGAAINFAAIPPYGSGGIGAGGGGGGYAGGGGGGTIVAQYTTRQDPTFRNVGSVLGTAAGGGGGSSFVGASTSGTNIAVGSNANRTPGTRNAGAIALYYCSTGNPTIAPNEPPEM